MTKILITLSLALFPAAVPGAETPAPSPFVQLVSRPWITLDPAAAADAVSFMAVGNVYEPLVAFRSAGETESFEPFLAAEVPTRANGLLSEDGRTYTFPVRKDVFFHGGEPLTAEDVRYSLLRFMLSDREGGASGLLLRPVLGVGSTRNEKGEIVLDFAAADRAVRAEGDRVSVTLARPDPSFLKALASLPIVVSKKWAADNGEWDGSAEAWKAFNDRAPERSFFHGHMNGTGPYALSRIEGRGDELVLRRNARYWRAPAPIETVRLRSVECSALRMTMLENGDADASYFEDRDIGEVKELPGVRLLDGLPYESTGETLFFNFDTDKASEFIGSGKLDGQGVPPDFFREKAVREAFAYAVDYKKYQAHGLAGRGRRACGPVPPSGHKCGGKAPYSHDLKKAGRLLRKAYGGRLWKEGFSLMLAFSPSNANRLFLARSLKDNLEKINPKFKVGLRTMPSRELYAAASAHSLPLFISGYYADYPDPSGYLFGLLHSSGHWARAQKYSNPALDDLIEKAAASADPAARAGLLSEIEDLAWKDLPQVYTYAPVGVRVARAWVKGLESQHNVSNMGLRNFPYFYVLSKE